MDPTVLSENLNKSLINLQTHSNKVHKERKKKKDYIKKIQIEIENYNKNLIQLELDTKNANLQIKELNLRDDFEKSTIESIEEANVLLKSQLDDIIEEVKSINDKNKQIKKKCEEKLIWYREKLNTRIQHYKKLPKFQEIEKVKLKNKDSKFSNELIQTELTKLKSEISSLIQDTGLEYGSIVDWGIAMATSMIKMKKGRKNNYKREDQIKTLETRMNKLKEKRSCIMEKRKSENENISAKKTTKGFLLDAQISKSSEMKSPLTLFDDFFKFSLKSSSKKREFKSCLKEKSVAKRQKHSFKLGSSGLKMTGNMPNFFSSIQNQIEKAGNIVFTTDKSNSDNNLKQQSMNLNLFKPDLPKLVELSSKKTFIKPNLKKAQSEIFSSNNASKKVTFKELPKRCKSYKSVHGFSKLSDSVFEKEVELFKDKNIRNKLSDEMNIHEDENQRATEEVLDTSLDRSFIEGEIIDNQPSQKTIEEAVDLNVEMTQIVDDFNEDVVPQAPPSSQSTFENTNKIIAHQIQISDCESHKLSQNSVSSQSNQLSQKDEFINPTTSGFVEENIEKSKSKNINKSCLSPLVNTEFEPPLTPSSKRTNPFAKKDGEFVVPAPPNCKLKSFEDVSCHSSHQTNMLTNFFVDSSSPNGQQNVESSGFVALFSSSGPEQIDENAENFSSFNFNSPAEDLNKSAGFPFDFNNQDDSTSNEAVFEFSGMFDTSNEEKSKGEDVNFQQIFGSNVGDANVSNSQSISYNFGAESEEDQTEDENAQTKLF